MIESCKSSQGLESPICEYGLSHLHEKLVNDYMDGNGDMWCDKSYFMKNVLEGFQKDPCSSINNLHSQLKTCDSENGLCHDLIGWSEYLDFESGIDLCQEKKFFFYLLERLLVMERPCELHKILSSMSTALTSKRSRLAKSFYKGADSIVSDENFVEVIQEWLDTSDFWSVDMCLETEHLESFLYDDMINDKCNALKNLRSYHQSCNAERFKKKNKIACKIAEAISFHEVPEMFKNVTQFDLFDLNPCEESDQALNHLKAISEKPCSFLESFKDLGECSDNSLYCKMMSGILAMIEGEGDEGLGGILSQWFGISITDINPCEIIEFISDLWVDIGEETCDVFKTIEKAGFCKSKSAPCKIFKKIVKMTTDSEMATGFEETFGFKLWQMNPCEEWKHVRKFLLALIDRPCSFFSLFESQHSAHCSKKGATSMVCTGLSFAASTISDSSEIQDFLSSIDLCAEQDYSVGIFKEVSKRISEDSCVGYKELSSYVDKCPKSQPILCSIFGGFMDCLGKTNYDHGKDAKNDDEEQDGMIGAINDVCNTIHGLRKGAASIESLLGEVCSQMFPEVSTRFK